MKQELHSDPSMAHAKKGSGALRAWKWHSREGKSGMAKKWIQGAVKHPGALT